MLHRLQRTTFGMRSRFFLRPPRQEVRGTFLVILNNPSPYAGEKILQEAILNGSFKFFKSSTTFPFIAEVKNFQFGSSKTKVLGFNRERFDRFVDKAVEKGVPRKEALGTFIAAWAGWDGSMFTKYVEVILPDDGNVVKLFCDIFKELFGAIKVGECKLAGYQGEQRKRYCVFAVHCLLRASKYTASLSTVWAIGFHARRLSFVECLPVEPKNKLVLSSSWIRMKTKLSRLRMKARLPRMTRTLVVIILDFAKDAVIVLDSDKDDGYDSDDAMERWTAPQTRKTTATRNYPPRRRRRRLLRRNHLPKLKRATSTTRKMR